MLVWLHPSRCAVCLAVCSRFYKRYLACLISPANTLALLLLCCLLHACAPLATPGRSFQRRVCSLTHPSGAPCTEVQ